MESKRVILILVDGMRPDSLDACGNSFVRELLQDAPVRLDMRTVIPSVTLPCHMSLFHSIPPERHGILSNLYTPQVRPVRGMFELFSQAGKRCASIYNWEELRDLGRPGSLAYSHFVSEQLDMEGADTKVTADALRYLAAERPDFLFLYLGVTDETGHHSGWMGREYLAAVAHAWECIERVFRQAGEEYLILITADHGGHDRTHGLEIPEDMTIPLIACGKGARSFREGQLSILDLAPTIAEEFGLCPDPMWEGRNLFGCPHQE